MSQREENKDGAATGEQVSLEKAKEDKSPNEENKEEPKEVKREGFPSEQFVKSMAEKGIKVRHKPNMPTKIFLHKKPLEK